MAASFDELVRFERRKRITMQAIVMATYVPLRWPAIRESVRERDTLRLCSLGLGVAATVPLAVADVRRVETKVAAEEADRRRRAKSFERARAGEPPQVTTPERTTDLALQATGSALIGATLLYFTWQRWRMDKS